MKVMKLALLGTAALAAVSVSARADDLADLKAQIEALNNRISQLEAAPAVPAGYQLLSVSEAPAIVVPSLDIDPAFGPTATNIGILPTADVPASTTIQWSGYARAALVHSKTKVSEEVLDAAGNVVVVGVPITTDFSTEDTDVLARGQLKVVGTTDTAVGEVGVVVQLRVNSEGLGDANVISNEHWGWWKMTPELTLGGGYTGSLANIGYGYDGACNCYYTDNAPVALNPGDTTQMRLSYASGPISFAIALEDHDQVVANRDATATLDDSLGVAGEIKYAGDTFSGEISGGYWGEGGDATSAQFGVFLPGGATVPAGILGAPTASDAWQLGVGLGFSFDPITLSLAAGAGQDHIEQDYWKASILASANLSDSVHAEIAYGYRSSDSYICTGTGAAAGSFCGETDADTHAVLAGIYYDPVSQLTIGLEGEWFQTKFDGGVGDDLFGGQNQYNAKSTTWSVDLVTVFRF